MTRVSRSEGSREGLTVSRVSESVSFTLSCSLSVLLSLKQ
jgi:hypothetical protein